MICFNKVDQEDFLDNFWQKKPLVIRQALPDFVNLITPEELAGLAMEEDIESRIVISTPKEPPFWHLKNGPFLETDFTDLPNKHWTLLVNGIDHCFPEISLLFDNFDFIPQWRIDDLMVSYATEDGSVGPHYDKYDVFLYQASGSRKWSLTTKKCHEDNYMANVPLRIMLDFDVEEEYILNEGDMLYLPSGVGHYGTALAGECMTYSFGYRSYVDQELWEEFGDYHSESRKIKKLYQDPNWKGLTGSSQISKDSWINAKQLMQDMLNDEEKLKSWFGCFVTRESEKSIDLPIQDFKETIAEFMGELSTSDGLIRQVNCRFAYIEKSKDSNPMLFINGEKWDTNEISWDLIKLVANNRFIPIKKLQPWFSKTENRQFLFEIYKLQLLEIVHYTMC